MAPRMYEARQATRTQGRMKGVFPVRQLNGEPGSIPGPRRSRVGALPRGLPGIPPWAAHL